MINWIITKSLEFAKDPVLSLRTVRESGVRHRVCGEEYLAFSGQYGPAELRLKVQEAAPTVRAIAPAQSRLLCSEPPLRQLMVKYYLFHAWLAVARTR
jgi:hypothetical protein